MPNQEYINWDISTRNRLPMSDKYDLPFVYAQNVNLENIELIAFDKIKLSEASFSNRAKTIHFFLEDYKFDEVWNYPDKQLLKLSQYKQLLSPDFSVYADMPKSLQIFNTFRNRWCAAYWQQERQVVIPTITWADESTYDFCFSGIEDGCVVAVSTVGMGKNEDFFIPGFKAMCKKIKPRAVLNYGKEFAQMHKYARIVNVEYQRPGKPE
jgi:hypothetical protein